MCKAYDQTLQCAKSNFCVKTPTFVLITSGLEDLCKTDKNTLMKNHEDCIKPKVSRELVERLDRNNLLRQSTTFHYFNLKLNI